MCVEWVMVATRVLCFRFQVPTCPCLFMLLLHGGGRGGQVRRIKAEQSGYHRPVMT